LRKDPEERIFHLLRGGSLISQGTKFIQSQSQHLLREMEILSHHHKGLRWSRGSVLAFGIQVRNQPKPSDF